MFQRPLALALLAGACAVAAASDSPARGGALTLLSSQLSCLARQVVAASNVASERACVRECWPASAAHCADLCGAPHAHEQVREGASVLVDSLACVAAPARSCSADDAFKGRCSPIEGDSVLARCASRLQRVWGSPTALLLLLSTAGLVVTLANGPAVCEWLQVQAELLSIQCQYLGQPWSVQKEVWLLLWLEKARRLEGLKVQRYRRQGRLDPVTGHLPHVDNLSAHFLKSYPR
jgi:hypothetical protein